MEAFLDQRMTCQQHDTFEEGLDSALESCIIFILLSVVILILRFKGISKYFCCNTVTIPIAKSEKQQQAKNIPHPRNNCRNHSRNNRNLEGKNKINK